MSPTPSAPHLPLNHTISLPASCIAYTNFGPSSPQTTYTYHSKNTYDDFQHQFMNGNPKEQSNIFQILQRPNLVCHLPPESTLPVI
jgi:hypothetical protein